ncbi:MAG: hypothetical protein A2008_00255 [Candidatus Wallbacteria bacterium GWC2_49_35]|uniref:Uncharacterized protein n=1 Tax=Candidatus Wallbacteria bacterium GWC2_49_35 TaxID=1817813 RepID=A0A1F7X2F0_9BACT|nr:MAG: hypothetical protein A2008_00255 [Candidatus Wallbacteria bacterium GWC2_49_35]
MPENKELVIKKHSAMIQTSVKNMTLTQRKAINFLIYIAQKSGHCATYKTTIANLKQACNLASSDNTIIKEQLKTLSKTMIEFNYLDKDKEKVWEISPLLAGCRIGYGTGIIEFAFSPFLLNRILRPEMYAPISIILIAGLKCSYAVVLYEFLRDYLTAPAIPVLTIEAFRNLLGIDEKKYTFFPSFKRTVLMPAIEEINLKTDISCRYELIKEKGIRNKYSHIRFFVNKKTGNLTYEKNEKNRKEKLDISGDLFEKIDMPDQSVCSIPEEILIEIPQKYRINSLFEEINKKITEGKNANYIKLNLKYAFKKAKENPLFYAINALKNNYAGFDIEVEEKKTREKKATIQAVQINKDQKKQDELALEIIRSLPPDQFEILYNEAKQLIIKENPGNPFFIRDSIIEIRMAQIYIEKSKKNNYQSNDND